MTGSWYYWVEIGQGFTQVFFFNDTATTETWAVIRQSLLISVTATLASMAVGVPLGVWLASAKFRGRGVLLAICNTGFGLPPVVVGLILSILLLRHGPLGALNLRFTPGAMIIGQFILSLPIIIGLTVVPSAAQSEIATANDGAWGLARADALAALPRNPPPLARGLHGGFRRGCIGGRREPDARRQPARNDPRANYRHCDGHRYGSLRPCHGSWYRASLASRAQQTGGHR